jgi:hypothetical protein
MKPRRPTPPQKKDQRTRKQDHQNIHLSPRIRCALSTTVTEDSNIAKAATKGVAKPAKAMGTTILTRAIGGLTI